MTITFSATEPPVPTGVLVRVERTGVAGEYLLAVHKKAGSYWFPLPMVESAAAVFAGGFTEGGPDLIYADVEE